MWVYLHLPDLHWVSSQMPLQPCVKFKKRHIGLQHTPELQCFIPIINIWAWMRTGNVRHLETVHFIAPVREVWKRNIGIALPVSVGEEGWLRSSCFVSIHWAFGFWRHAWKVAGLDYSVHVRNLCQNGSVHEMNGHGWQKSHIGWNMSGQSGSSRVRQIQCNYPICTYT